MQFPLRLLSGLCCLLLAIPLFAQIQTKTKFSSTNESKSITSDTDLWRSLTNGRSAAKVDDAITAYQLLEINEESRTQLLHTSPAQLQLSLPVAPGDRPLEMELEEVYPFGPGFSVRTASGATYSAGQLGRHFRGQLRGVPGSHVAFSILPGELQALIARPNEPNLVLGLLEDNEGLAAADYLPYILYEDAAVFQRETFDCGTADSAIPYAPAALRLPSGSGARSSSGGCVQVYFEVDHDIFLKRGSSTAAAAYVTAAFNEVATLYANVGVELGLSEIFVWDNPSPYGGSSSGTLLSQFQTHRTSFNGDIGQLLSFQASGGIAILSGLCHPFTRARMSFSSIGNSFKTVPTYSWTVMVIAHELGHLLGSQHTHACVWNGNSTAIDGCAGFTEGSCPNPGAPPGGKGSIMSYCHTNGVGIDFTTGFGPQPGAVIYNTVNNASCLSGSSCGGNPPPPPPPPPGNPPNDGSGCTDNEVVLALTLDDFGMETTWRLETESQTVVASGGPYAKKQAGTVMRDTFCLPDGCYNFRMLDADSDGICCQYGEGSYRLSDLEANILVEGAEFGSSEVKDFCVPFGSPPPEEAGCVRVNFVESTLISYGLNQDAGQGESFDAGRGAYLANNAWKAIPLTYDITSETVMTFEFRSTIEGEIHGIGFDDDLGISPDFTFRLHGTQSWGNGSFDNYSGDGSWQSYTIPVGDFLSGRSAYLFFVADHDIGNRNGNSFFRNVEIFEGQSCLDNLPDQPGTAAIPTAGKSAVWPNPAGGMINLSTPGPGNYRILSLTGQEVSAGRVEASGEHRINLDGLPSGTYVLRFQDGNREYTHRFTRMR